MGSGTSRQTGIPVTLHVGTESVDIQTRSSTVEALLAEHRIGVGPLDTVSPELETAIVPGLEIVIVRQTREFEVRDTMVPASTHWVGDRAMDLDTQALRVRGSNGLERTRTRVLYRNGDPVQRDHAESWIVREPVATQYAYGQKITKRYFVTPEGETIAYWRKTRMHATSYSASRAGTPRDAPWYGYTFSGDRMRTGVIATHLDTVPLRTRVYVPGYGHGDILDTGFGLKPRMIDLGYDDENWVSWRATVDMYWLWPPPDPDEITWMLPPL